MASGRKDLDLIKPSSSVYHCIISIGNKAVQGSREQVEQVIGCRVPVPYGKISPVQQFHRTFSPLLYFTSPFRQNGIRLIYFPVLFVPLLENGERYSKMKWMLIGYCSTLNHCSLGELEQELIWCLPSSSKLNRNHLLRDTCTCNLLPIIHSS